MSKGCGLLGTTDVRKQGAGAIQPAQGPANNFPMAEARGKQRALQTCWKGLRVRSQPECDRLATRSQVTEQTASCYTARSVVYASQHSSRDGRKEGNYKLHLSHKRPVALRS